MLKAKKLFAAALGTLVIVGAMAAFASQGGLDGRTGMGSAVGPAQLAAMAASSDKGTPTPQVYEAGAGARQHYEEDHGRYFAPYGEQEHERREQHKEREHEEDDD
jgi:hypothetical protein